MTQPLGRGQSPGELNQTLILAPANTPPLYLTVFRSTAHTQKAFIVHQ